MRYLRYVFLIAVGFCLLVVALANRGVVGIKLLPEEMAAYIGQPFQYEVPLFMIPPSARNARGKIRRQGRGPRAFGKHLSKLSSNV